jgi:single-strand DNA-binding protein
MPHAHNQVQLTGRAGHLPEIFTMTDGTMMARLRLYQSVTNHSGERSSTAFSLVAWGSLAEALHRSVRRGDNLFVLGKLRIRIWKQEGINHLRPEVHLDGYHLLQRPSNRRVDVGEAGPNEITVAPVKIEN